MSCRLEIGPQVAAFSKTLHPALRRALKREIAGLPSGKGDVRALTDKLSGWYRLRVGRHRVIFRYQPNGVIQCAFAEERSLVYELWEAEIGRMAGK